MQQERITGELAVRLRRGGTDFRRADLTAFAAGIPPSEGDPDIDALAVRFVEASRVYVAEITRRNHAGRVLTVGVLVLASGVVGLVVAVLSIAATTDGPSPHPNPLNILIVGGAGLVVTLLGMGATMYGAACMAWADTRLKKLLREAANPGAQKGYEPRP